MAARMITMDVVGVRIELPSNQPLVLLKEAAGELHLPIWIGTPEASAIALAQQEIVPPRPLTHDLLCDVVKALGRTLREVRMVAVRDSVYYAELVFDDGVTVSSRASDAIALALRAPCPVLCAAEVLAEAGVRIADADAAAEDTTEEGVESAESAESQLRQFREFLNHVEPDDFGG